MDTNTQNLLEEFGRFLNDSIDLATTCLEDLEANQSVKDREFYEGIMSAYCVALAKFEQVFASDGEV